MRLDAVTVRFGATTALDSVSIDVVSGEIHALVGENGAGKSTLVRLIAGDLAADSRSIWIRPGTEIAWAPQEPVLAPDFTVAEWIFLARELCSRLRLLRQGEMRRETVRVLAEVGCNVMPDTRVGDLSSVQRKQVQLARALLGAPGLLLLDEPTAALGSAEAVRLFQLLRRLRENGCAVVFITHRLDEVQALADRVTVLRDGRHISTDSVAAVDTDTLVRRMVGRELARVSGKRVERQPGDVLLRVENLAVAQVVDVSFDVRRGEIVGLAGLVGSGRSETLETIAGMRSPRSGSVWHAVKPVLVAEDRSAKGLVPTLDMRGNIFLPATDWHIDAQKERRETRRWIADLSIRSRGPDAEIDSLSGGNQQKLLLARALRHNPRILLLDEPTAGVDVGAKADIHLLLRHLADDGAAVVLASSDLLELLSLCDRIVALRSGRSRSCLSNVEADEARLGALITGAA